MSKGVRGMTFNELDVVIAVVPFGDSAIPNNWWQRRINRGNFGGNFEDAKTVAIAAQGM
jgi:hypothetical protein